MKNIKNILAIIITGITLSMNAQELSVDNTKLVPPAANQSNGYACFDLVAEDGVVVRSTPLALEITLSKMTADLDNINGFNSKNFDYQVDEFSPNVIRATLTNKILSLSNGEGGAQICLSVTAPSYQDARAGFAVNIVPGVIKQNIFDDYIDHFGFASSALSYNDLQTEMTTQSSLGHTPSVEVTLYPNPATDKVNVQSQGATPVDAITVYNSLGQIVYVNVSYEDKDQFAVSDWTEGVYYMEMKDAQDEVIQTERFIVGR